MPGTLYSTEVTAIEPQRLGCVRAVSVGLVVTIAGEDQKTADHSLSSASARSVPTRTRSKAVNVQIAVSVR